MPRLWFLPWRFVPRRSAPVCFAGLLTCLLAAPAARAQDAPAQSCALQPDLLTPAAPLPHVAAALAKHHLDVLALGSGSTVGESGGAGGPALVYHAPGTSYPFRMAEALQSRQPPLQVNLTVKGGKNLTAADMLPLLQAALSHGHFDLVLWQTGTVEAVHGIRPDELRDVLTDGVASTVAANTDLVLIDPQFSRFLRANADITPYETVLRQVASMDGVTLFPRLDLTESWVSNGEIDLERVNRDARDRTIGLLNRCLGGALAHFILAGAGEH